MEIITHTLCLQKTTTIYYLLLLWKAKRFEEISFFSLTDRREIFDSPIFFLLKVYDSASVKLV